MQLHQFVAHDNQTIFYCLMNFRRFQRLALMTPSDYSFSTAQNAVTPVSKFKESEKLRKQQLFLMLITSDAFIHSPRRRSRKTEFVFMRKLESSHETSKLPVADEFKNKSARI